MSCRLPALSIGLMLLATACLDPGPPAAVSTMSMRADPDRPVGAALTGDPDEPDGATGSDAGAADQGISVACNADRSTLEVAVEAYRAIHGRLPTDESELVAGGLLVGPSPRYDLGPDATIVATPGSGC